MFVLTVNALAINLLKIERIIINKDGKIRGIYTTFTSQSKKYTIFVDGKGNLKYVNVPFKYFKVKVTKEGEITPYDLAQNHRIERQQGKIQKIIFFNKYNIPFYYHKDGKIYKIKNTTFTYYHKNGLYKIDISKTSKDLWFTYYPPQKFKDKFPKVCSINCANSITFYFYSDGKL